MRPTSIPKTPKGRWVGHHGPGHFAEQTYDTPEQAAAALAELDALEPGAIVTVGTVYSSEEDLIDGDTFAELLIQHLMNALAKLNPTGSEGWPRRALGQEGRPARAACALKIRGAVMAWLIEAGDFPPPWYSAPERFYRVEAVGAREIAAFLILRKLRGQIPETIADRLPAGSFQVLELQADAGPMDAWGIREKSAPHPCRALAEILDAVAEGIKFARFTDPGLGEPWDKPAAPSIDPESETQAAIERGSCAACPIGPGGEPPPPAFAVRPVENPTGGTTDLGLCRAHASAFDRGDPIRWIGTPVVREIGKDPGVDP